MKRLFLSAPTTCALLLGAGLLLRAQAALRADPTSGDARAQTVKEEPTAPSDVLQGPAAAHVDKGRQGAARKGTFTELREQRSSHRGKTKAPRARNQRTRKRAAARLADEQH